MSTQTSPRKRILVVEDEAPVQAMMRTMLEGIGCEVIAAADVSAAVQVLRSFPLPDLVVLDLMLPDIDGFELLRQMRAKSMFDQLPIVIVSALADPDQIRRGLDMGADRYLTKPNMSHNLIRVVREVFREGRRRVAEG